MAHLLKQAHEKELRRIIIVLPFTNIIQQSVKIYRDALVFDDENPCDIVAELHHRADFQDKESRYLTALWRAPIIVTTAVTFFETLASNSPSTLRRLHELPGSAIFVDESHAALPVKLLPLTLNWINVYSREWSCYWLLASGSLTRFWNIDEINCGTVYNIPELIDTNLRDRLSLYEKRRIQYRYDQNAKNLKGLANWVLNFPGPRLLIVNTVQNAAIIADYFKEKFGEKKVEHLSTALTPKDRTFTEEKIKKRLADQTDNDWTLVATSCVEAGINISFRTGFREISSLLSLLQTAGRINRNGEYDYSEIWSFTLKECDNFNKNPGLKYASDVLQKYFEENIEITPELSTEAINLEIQAGGITSGYKKLLNSEQLLNFPEVEKSFKVINTDTRLVIVEEEIIKAIKCHVFVSWNEIQGHSVRIYGYNLTKYDVDEFLPGIYKWKLPYDNFIGIMRGALPVIKTLNGVVTII
jgi:CRISPR/Cas system-associated endonuclease/helicase Cas3